MNTNYRILVVDDEEDLCDILKFNLENEGYEVETANSAEEALKMDLTKFHLLLLDVMMGEISGFKMAKMLKQVRETCDIPIIFLTARDTENDAVTGFTLGADDYISKPFSLREVQMRIKAVLRRTNRNSNTDKELKCGDLRILVGRHEVFCKDEKIELTRKEFELLVYLVENRGLVMSRNQILCQVWGYEFEGETRTVDVHVRSVRQKLGEAGNMVETVRGVGYRIDK